MKTQAEQAYDMLEAQIESVKADTRRTLALAREIELRNQQTERTNNNYALQQGLQPLRRC